MEDLSEVLFLQKRYFEARQLENQRPNIMNYAAA